MKRDDKGRILPRYELEGDYKEIHDDYMGWVEGNEDKQNTADRKRSGSLQWLGWCQEAGNHPIKDAEEDLVRKFIGHLKTEGNADTTISRAFSAVSEFYEGVDNNPRMADIEHNPTEKISLPDDYGIRNYAEYRRHITKNGKEEIIAPPKSDILEICEHPPGELGYTKTRNQLILLILWHTALRADEIVRIKRDNVDMEQREIKIRSAKLDADKHPDLYIRRVWYEPNADHLLHRHLSTAPESEYLFSDNEGNKLDPSTITEIVKDAASDAGLQEPLVYDKNGNISQHLFTAHRFRHARISHMANETNMDLNHLRMFAGHAKFETTLEYVKTDWESARNSYFQAIQ